MCIAVVTTPGKFLDAATLWKGWTVNQHGGGFAFVENDEVIVKKGYMLYNEFQHDLAEAHERVGAESPFLVHMRISTSGGITANNTHPFPLSRHKAAFIHNGRMFTPSGDWIGPKEDRKSDTRAVAEALGNIFDLESLKKGRGMLGNAIGLNNKLAFLYPSKEFIIVNEDQGWWNDGIWYSNGSCGVYRPVAGK